MIHTRNGEPVEISWLLLDASHPDYAAALDKLRVAHEKAPDLALSVNTRNDGSRSLVKVLGTLPDLPAGVILRTYIDRDHGEAVTLTATRATELDPSAGWRKPEVAKEAL